MFNFFKSKDKPKEAKNFSNIKNGLLKTKNHWLANIQNFFSSSNTIDNEFLTQMENHLLMSDLGLKVTKKIMAAVENKVKSHVGTKDKEWLLGIIKEELYQILNVCDKPPIHIDGKPFVILMVGINGVGKTTTIGKIANKFKLDGYKCLLAAGDTYRAAAIEQLQIWGERNEISVLAQKTGADPAAVIYDAISSAKAKEIDIVIADTAGRLHTQDHLMQELKKIVKVIKKIDVHAPHEIILMLDATLGQNAINQAKQFKDLIGLTGIVITKLDGTAKGGVIFPIAEELKIPIRYLGVGEGINDLIVFSAKDFIETLLMGARSSSS
jgi:fused signal recognition particle receptor